MTEVLVLYCSSFGPIETMAAAVAEGAREAGAEATVERVPEIVPEAVARQAGIKLDQAAPIATVDELPQYGAIVLGTPTRFGNMTAQKHDHRVGGGALPGSPRRADRGETGPAGLTGAAR